MKCQYCKWNGVASVEDDELARCPRCGEDTIKQKMSLMEAIERKDKKAISELEERSKKGEVIWLI